MIRQLAVVLATVLASSTCFAQNSFDIESKTQIISADMNLAQAQLSSYPALKAKLKASLDAVSAKLAEPTNAQLKSNLDSAISKMEQLKRGYFANHNRKFLTAMVDEYKKIKFSLKPLTDALAPVMEAPLDILDTISDYEGPNLVVNWSEIDSITSDYKKMVMAFAEADNMVRTISENSENYVNSKLAEGEPVSISLYDEADLDAIQHYLNQN